MTRKLRQSDSPADDNPLNLPLIRPPAMPAALLRTIQNWQHWKDVRKRAVGIRDTPYEFATGGKSSFKALTATTISVRLLTLSARRIALT